MENIYDFVSNLNSDPQYADSMAYVRSLLSVSKAELTDDRGFSEIQAGLFARDTRTVRFSDEGGRDVEYLAGTTSYSIVEQAQDTLYRIGREDSGWWLSLNVSSEDSRSQLTVYLPSQFLRVTPDTATWHVDEGLLTVTKKHGDIHAELGPVDLLANVTSVITESAYSPLSENAHNDIVKTLGYILTGVKAEDDE